MPFCPKCRSEYQDWVRVCVDCGAELVDELPEPAPPPPQRPKPAAAPPEPLVTIATFAYPEQAHLNRAYLESFGIKSFVGDEHVLQANRLYSIAVGGAKLRVRESDAEEALSLLGDIPEKIIERAPGSVESEGDYCPQCDSADIYYEKVRIRPIFIIMLIFGFLLPFLKRKWKCRSCGFEWKE